jgi:hypothetical protein
MGIQLRSDGGAGAGAGRIVGWSADRDESYWYEPDGHNAGDDDAGDAADKSKSWDAARTDRSHISATMKKARTMAGLFLPLKSKT